MDGFHKDIKFIAIIDPGTGSVTRIILKLTDNLSEQRLKQIYGEGMQPDDGSDTGNINIFQIQARYNREELFVHIESLIQRTNPVINGLKSLQEYLTAMNLEKNAENYKKWYKKQILVEFPSMEFNYWRHAKVKRDVHDELFKNNTDIRFEFITNLIASE